MGKKGKNIKTEDIYPLPKESEPEDDVTNVLTTKKKKKSVHSISFGENSASNSNTDLQLNVGKKIKSNRKRALNGDVTDSVPALTNDNLEKSTFAVKNNKNEKIKIASDPEVNKKEGNEEMNSTTDSAKKKKKKNKDHSSLIDENKPDIQIESRQDTEIWKKKIKSKDSTSEKVEIEIANNDNSMSVKTKTKKKKNKSKIAILNAEEAQVTEEDIDRFCDELDEEDNKQFDDWVQQLEASLPPRRTAK